MSEKLRVIYIREKKKNTDDIKPEKEGVIKCKHLHKDDWQRRAIILYYGSVYVIVNAKTIVGHLQNIEKALGEFMRGSEYQNDPTKNRYYPLFDYIKNNPNFDFSVEIKSLDGQSDESISDIVDALVKERENDDNCLNKLFKR